MKAIPTLLAAAALAALGGCATNSSALVFGTSDTVGLTISGGANEGGGEVTLGYKEHNLAVSPVVNQNNTVLGANDPGFDGNSPGMRGASDTYTVLGSFSLGTNNQNVTLGRFFSTGFAARDLARGFACAEATKAYGARDAGLDPSACVNWRSQAQLPPVTHAQATTPPTQGSN